LISFLKKGILCEGNTNGKITQNYIQKVKKQETITAFNGFNKVFNNKLPQNLFWERFCHIGIFTLWGLLRIMTVEAFRKDST